MKTKVIEEYYTNGKLSFRYHLTEDKKFHGLDEWYYKDGTIDYLTYWNMGNRFKLENDYYDDIVEIIYYI